MWCCTKCNSASEWPYHFYPFKKVNEKQNIPIPITHLLHSLRLSSLDFCQYFCEQWMFRQDRKIGQVRTRYADKAGRAGSLHCDLLWANAGTVRVETWYQSKQAKIIWKSTGKFNIESKSLEAKHRGYKENTNTGTKTLKQHNKLAKKEGNTYTTRKSGQFVYTIYSANLMTLNMNLSTVGPHSFGVRVLCTPALFSPDELSFYDEPTLRFSHVCDCELLIVHLPHWSRLYGKRIKVVVGCHYCLSPSVIRPWLQSVFCHMCVDVGKKKHWRSVMQNRHKRSVAIWSHTRPPPPD